jgi:hypothetical protein
LVKVDLESEWGDPVQVELSHQRYRALALAKGGRVYLIPKERRVFVQ